MSIEGGVFIEVFGNTLFVAGWVLAVALGTLAMLLLVGVAMLLRTAKRDLTPTP